MSERRRQQLEHKLDARQDQLLNEVRHALAHTENLQYLELIDRGPADVGEQSVADALADLNLSLLDRHVQELRGIERVKVRINEPHFGVCVDCREDVGFARLLALPSATRCTRCQHQHERTYAHEKFATL